MYRNIFKNSQEIIDLLKSDREVSFFTPWYDWYGQGFRKDSDFNLLETLDEKDDSNLALEKELILQINECMKFIRQDYLDEFKEKKASGHPL